MTMATLTRRLSLLLIAGLPLSATADTFVYEVATALIDDQGKKQADPPVRGTWTISFDDSIFRLDAYLTTASPPYTAVPFSESHEAGAYLSRHGGQELKVAPLQPLSRMQFEADAWVLAARIPKGGERTEQELRLQSLFPNTDEQITFRQGGDVPTKSVLLSNGRPMMSSTYTFSGPRGETGPHPGYKVQIVRRWADGRLVTIEDFRLKERTETPPTSLTAGLNAGDRVIDERLGPDDQRNYRWNGKIPSIAELEKMGSPLAGLTAKRSPAYWATMAAGLVFALLLLRFRPRLFKVTGGRSDGSPPSD